MKILGQRNIDTINHNVSIIQSKTGLSKRLLKVYLLLSISIMLITMSVCTTIIMSYDIEEVRDSLVQDDVIDSSNEIYAIPDNVLILNEMKGKLVHAGRYDEIPKNSKYDRYGLPLDRNWLTSSEWKGKHLSDPRDISIFKTWKIIHMNTFLEYVKSAAKEETKVAEYSKIPASLIAAQAVLESAFGVSRVSVDANNLFGHKCHDCTDPDDYVEAHDDSPTDRFKVRKDKWQSIRAHSKLLMRKYYPRIPKSKRDNPDIKDWLNALCNCGRELSVKKAKRAYRKGKFSYATSCYTGDKGYAQKIMEYIDLYDLYKLDLDD